MELKPEIRIEDLPIREQKLSYPQEWYEKKWGIVMISMFAIIFLASAYLAWSFYIIVSKSNGLNLGASNQAPDISAVTGDVKSITTDEMRKKVEAPGRPYFGNSKASLVIVEFGDFQCPHCQAEFPILRSFIEKNKNDLMLIFRNYPIIDENSLVISEASMCAYDQGKFWPMHDQLFLSAGKISSLEDLSVVAQKVGLDKTKFDTCLQSGKNKAILAEDFQMAVDVGVEGTPTFFVNGYKVQGVITADQWAQILAKAKEDIKK